MGGETHGSQAPPSGARGLSPRGRGNHGAGRTELPESGSIPAWAGKPLHTGPGGSRSEVYPRVGGETDRTAKAWRSVDGLSPRGRGNPRPARAARRPMRSIPAWAGKPWQGHDWPRMARVYPRVGGETKAEALRTGPSRGLSPRGRGNLPPHRRRDTRRGSIPAWAGKPPASSASAHRKTVYPRVGGETAVFVTVPLPNRGLSPRGRGNPRPARAARRPMRSIPAWAGKPGRRWASSRLSAVYPRVGGETPGSTIQNLGMEGLSPRGRGTDPSSAPNRLIHFRWRVYPRVGGETWNTPSAFCRAAGLSPRGRGNHASKL